MNKKIIIIIGAVAILLIAFFTTLFFKQKREMEEMIKLMDYEKEVLEQEYEELSYEYQEFSYTINNDSLVNLLTQEQQRVQMLLEELKTVKSTNARRISELKKELVSVRKVMQHYITQIDSLSQENKALVSENTVVKQKYQEATHNIKVLSEEKEILNEQITRASMLDARNINLELLNNNGKAVSRLKRASVMKLSFTIAKNITTPTGIKNLYVCIVNPDNKILTKNNAGTFFFEDKELPFSIRKEYEYEGEDTLITLYWTIEELLQEGAYQINIFSENNLIGSNEFVLTK